MQIICLVDQKEAIRRGFDASSTVKLDVNPAGLSEAQRVELAKHFADGKLFGWAIPTPDFKGLLEVLDAAVAESEKADKLLQENKAAQDARIAQLVAARKTIGVRHVVQIAREGNGIHTYRPRLELEGGPLPHQEIDGELLCSEEFVERVPDSGIISTGVSMYDLLTHPDTAGWKEELLASNTVALDKCIDGAEQKAMAILGKKLAAERAKEEAVVRGIETLKEWVLESGSAHLQMRLQEGFEWVEEAVTAYLDAFKTEIRLGEDNLPAHAVPVAIDAFYGVREITRLREIRDAATDHPLLKKLKATASVQLVTYAIPVEPDGPDTHGRSYAGGTAYPAVWLTVHTLWGDFEFAESL